MLWVVVTQMTVTMSSVGLIAGDDSPQSDSQLLLRVFQNLPQGYLGTDPQICWCRFLLTVFPRLWLLPTHCETTYLDTNVHCSNQSELREGSWKLLEIPLSFRTNTFGVLCKIGRSDWRCFQEYQKQIIIIQSLHSLYSTLKFLTRVIPCFFLDFFSTWPSAAVLSETTGQGFCVAHISFSGIYWDEFYVSGVFSPFEQGTDHFPCHIHCMI